MPEQAANEQSLKQFIGRDKGLDIRTIHALRILKRSIDARQRTIYVNLKVRLYINEVPQDEEFIRTIYNKVEGKPQVIVVGAGPGGLFAALRLIELGLRPVVVERGKNVRDRKIDIARISREHHVDRIHSEFCLHYPAFCFGYRAYHLNRLLLLLLRNYNYFRSQLCAHG